MTKEEFDLQKKVIQYAIVDALTHPEVMRLFLSIGALAGGQKTDAVLAAQEFVRTIQTNLPPRRKEATSAFADA